MTIKRLAILSAVVLSAALAVAACGSNGNSGGGAGSGTGGSAGSGTGGSAGRGTGGSAGSGTGGSAGSGTGGSAGVGGSPPTQGTPVCGKAILQSPYNYTGAAGAYTSGKAGLPTYGGAGTDFPNATAGMVLPPETKDYANYQLNPKTVYYLEPGMHYGSFSALTGDVFVGGYANGTGATLDGQYSRHNAVDFNITLGEQTNVTIEYLTIQKFTPPVDQVAINQDGGTGWKLLYCTVTLNVPGGGMFAASNNVLKDNCMTLNGQYGFQSSNDQQDDSLTGGPYNVWVENNEISYNDTCDLEGTITNAAAGLNKVNPVPAQDRNSHCGTVTGDGNQGGFKLWATDGVMIKDNWIHNNFGAGGWADTDNANTTWTGNTITDNDAQAIMEEISYNFSITNNYIAGNNVVEGPDNAGFPMSAIYVSESGSDSRFGGVPGCTMSTCVSSGMPGYTKQSIIANNKFIDNGGGVFLWQNSNRNCTDGYDNSCTLVKGGAKGPFTIANCQANLPGATINRTTYTGNVTGSPAEDWWDGCMWQTENVLIDSNTFDFNPAHIPHCDNSWPDCGAVGVFSEYGGPNNNANGSDVPTQITFFQHNKWSNNTYAGPSKFFAWNQGNLDDPVTWQQWSGPLSGGDKCSSSGEHQSGTCSGPFGQDVGSTFTATPP